MERKLHELLDHLEVVYGADFRPRVVGPYCKWPRDIDTRPLSGMRSAMEVEQR
jgi:hypothetical protein